MAKVKIYLDPVGNTMNIWWDDKNKASASEEVDDPARNDVIIKDRSGKPISLELIGVFPEELNVSEIVKKLTGKNIKDPILLHS